MRAADHLTVGIDDMAAYIPQLFLPIETLAEARDLEYAKLNKGLGLEAMAVPDVGEDAATMMANAVRELIERNDLQPQDIGRMYLGTESALDGAKPTATYALEMLQSYFAEEYGPDCFLHCDVVDMTFACIGAVDALQNTLDWVRCGEDRLGIVVASDVAKYELGSGGEYTQGAGAVAALVKTSPRLLAIDPTWGVGTRPVHDFFKPTRQVRKGDLIAEVLQLANRNHVNIDDLVRSLERTIDVNGIIDGNETILRLHKETPVFDGPYSNDCYQQRIGEALQHYKLQQGIEPAEPVATNWERLVFHLPYAYQARRMFGEIYWEEQKSKGQGDQLLQEMELTEPQAGDYPDEATYRKALSKFYRAVTKTGGYRCFVQQRIEKGERASSLVGNMYTGSIFLALMSSFEADLEDTDDSLATRYGCFAYGSGSKSKVFVGTLQPAWREVASRFQLMEQLDNRTPIDYATYESLHRGNQQAAVAPREGAFYLENIHEERDVREGARSYRFKPVQAAAPQPAPAQYPG